jgi:hypothetical protein
MPRPWIGLQFFQTLHQSGPQGVQVNVSGQLQKIGIVFTDYRSVSVLEEMSKPFVPFIEIHDIPGQEFPHVMREGVDPRFEPKDENDSVSMPRHILSYAQLGKALQSGLKNLLGLPESEIF